MPLQDAVVDEVRQFAGDLKKRLLEGRFRHVKAFADRPELTGVGRSTVYDALRGLRLPSDVTVAGLLSSVAQADQEEISGWLQRRADLAALTADPAPPTDPHLGSTASEGHRGAGVKRPVSSGCGGGVGCRRCDGGCGRDVAGRAAAAVAQLSYVGFLCAGTGFAGRGGGGADGEHAG